MNKKDWKVSPVVSDSLIYKQESLFALLTFYLKGPPFSLHVVMNMYVANCWRIMAETSRTLVLERRLTKHSYS